MTTVIDRALAHSASYIAPSTRDTLVDTRARLNDRLDNLLPVEETARKELDGLLQTTTRALRMIDLSKEIGLPVLSQEVFSWTKMQRSFQRRFGLWEMLEVPALAYIPVDRNSCQIGVNRMGRAWINDRESYYRQSDMPSGIEEAYLKIASKLAVVANDRRLENLSINYAYRGLVPDDVRAIVKTEQARGRFDRLAFVCDVDHWQVQQIKAPPVVYLDPILVGEKGGALWVLASFDPTPVESYIAAEFTS